MARFPVASIASIFIAHLCILNSSLLPGTHEVQLTWFWMFSNWCLRVCFTLLRKHLSICYLKISSKIRCLCDFLTNILYIHNASLIIFAGINFRGSQTIQSIYFSLLCRWYHSKHIILCVPRFSTILTFFTYLFLWRFPYCTVRHDCWYSLPLVCL